MVRIRSISIEQLFKKKNAHLISLAVAPLTCVQPGSSIRVDDRGMEFDVVLAKAIGDEFDQVRQIPSSLNDFPSIIIIIIFFFFFAKSDRASRRTSTSNSASAAPLLRSRLVPWNSIGTNDDRFQRQQ